MTQSISRQRVRKGRKGDGSFSAISEEGDGSPQGVEGARRHPAELCTRRGLKPLLTLSRSLRGKVELSIRPRRPGNRILLPFEWSEAAWGDGCGRIRNVFSITLQDYSLVEAATPTAARSAAKKHDWAAMAEGLKEWKTMADNAITPVTWAHGHEPVISMPLALWSGNAPPPMAQQLIDGQRNDLFKPLVLDAGNNCFQGWRRAGHGLVSGP